MFSDDYKVANPKLTPNSSSDVKVIEITPYLGVNGTGPLYLALVSALKICGGLFHHSGHKFKSQLSEFDTIKYDSNIAFHCETWSFSQGICLLLPSLNDGGAAAGNASDFSIGGSGFETLTAVNLFRL